LADKIALLPTPRASEFDGRGLAKRKLGTGGRMLGETVSLLPTPRTTDFHSPGEHGQGGRDLRTEISMLPTPNASEAVKGRDKVRPCELNRKTPSMGVQVGVRTGLRLQPDFAGWMMGYPKGWCDLEDGEMPRSKRMGTR
jgi:DNA (cytosine-5)-methyltransferase 1